MIGMSTHSEILPLGQSIVSAQGWDGATRAIMLAGKHLPVLPESSRSSRTLVPGCESQVWLALDTNTDKTMVRAYSPSKIIRGVLAVLLEKANSVPSNQRAEIDFHQYLAACQLERHLSQSRANGIAGVIDRLKTL